MFVFGSLDSSSHLYSEEDSSNMPAMPKLEISVDTKEAVDENQTENLPKSAEGMESNFLHLIVSQK